MAFKTIQKSDYKERLISNLPTRPNASPGNFGGGGLTAAQMKQAYDAMPLFIISRLNDLIVYINGTGDERLSDSILSSIKGVLAAHIPADISDEIKTLSDLFDSVKSGELAKVLFVPSGQKPLDEMIGVLNEYEAKFNDYDSKYARFESVSASLLGFEPRLSRVEKQVENFYRGGALPVIEDSTVAYAKIVPDGALPYAEVAKVGGMSHVVDGTLIHAKVTAVKVKAENLFDIDEVRYGYTDNGSYVGFKRAISATIPYRSPMFVKINGLPSESEWHYEIEHYSGEEYSSLIKYSGWFRDTDERLIEDIDGAKYIAILVGYVSTNEREDLTMEDVRQVIEQMGIEVYYGNRYAYSLEIPAAVQALPDYGLGVSATVNNHVYWSERNYHNICGEANLGLFDWLFGGYYAYPNVANNFAKPEGACVANVPNDITSYSINESGIPVFIFPEGAYANADEVKSAMQGVTLVYELAEPETVDISHLIIKDNFIPVEVGGQIVVENEYELAAPTTIIYQEATS